MTNSQSYKQTIDKAFVFYGSGERVYYPYTGNWTNKKKLHAYKVVRQYAIDYGFSLSPGWKTTNVVIERTGQEFESYYENGGSGYTRVFVCHSEYKTTAINEVKNLHTTDIEKIDILKTWHRTRLEDFLCGLLSDDDYVQESRRIRTLSKEGLVTEAIKHNISV